jgi:hypothetical protein
MHLNPATYGAYNFKENLNTIKITSVGRMWHQTVVNFIIYQTFLKTHTGSYEE